MFARKQAYLVKRSRFKKKGHSSSVRNNLLIELKGARLFLAVGKSLLRDWGYYCRFCLPVSILFAIPLMSNSLMHAIQPNAYIAKNLSKMTVFFSTGHYRSQYSIVKQ